MKKRNGFTLIELLAVIIVLAIIALIAMPIIFNVIENAKLKSMENSAYGVIDAVRLQYMENLMNSEDGTVPLSGSATSLTLSGEHPTGGTWTIVNSAEVKDGRGIKIEGVTFASMQGYICNSVIKDGKLTGKVECAKQKEEDIVFEAEAGFINEKGWANKVFDIKVTANEASSLKVCASRGNECTTEITNDYVCIEEVKLYDYKINTEACVQFGIISGMSQAEAEILCADEDKTAVAMVESAGISPQTLIDAGVISDFEDLGKYYRCNNSSSGDQKIVFDMKTNSLLIPKNIILRNDFFDIGNNYVCAEAEGLQSNCEVYRFDSITPTLTAKTPNPTVEFGVSEELNTYLNKPTYGVSGGNIVCKDSSNNEITNTSGLAAGTHTVTCNAVGNNGLSSSDVTLTIKVEKITPTLTAKTSNVTVSVGYSNEMSTYFSEPTYGKLGGSIVCRDSKNNEITNTSQLTLGTHTITCNAVGNNGLSSSDITLTIKVEKIIRLSVDANSNGIAELGDEVCIGSECFYVLTNDGTNIRMLAKYRIDVSNNTTRKDRLQNTGTLTTTFSSSTIHGTNLNSYEGSIVEDLVEDYKTTLEGLGATISDATLLSRAEVISAPFSCQDAVIGSCNPTYSWLYKDGNTTGAGHWTLSSDSNSPNNNYVWSVLSGGYVRSYSCGITYGVRPVVTISTSVLN